MHNLETTKNIVFELIKSSFLTRRHCHVCGGNTEKDLVLCEVTEGEYKGTRVCPRCIESRDFDQRLEKNSKKIERELEFTLSMIGRLKTPTIDEFNDMREAINKAIMEQQSWRRH